MHRAITILMLLVECALTSCSSTSSNNHLRRYRGLWECGPVYQVFIPLGGGERYLINVPSSFETLVDWKRLPMHQGASGPFQAVYLDAEAYLTASTQPMPLRTLHIVSVHECSAAKAEYITQRPKK